MTGVRHMTRHPVITLCNADTGGVVALRPHAR
jgi:hypothetical protein